VQVMAWPLMFWMVATRIGWAAEPVPREIATAWARESGLRRAPCSTSCRDQATAVFISCTLKPARDRSRAVTMMSGEAQVMAISRS